MFLQSGLSTCHIVKNEDLYTAKSFDKGKSGRSKKGQGRPSTAGGGTGGAGSLEGGAEPGSVGVEEGSSQSGGRELVVAAVYDARETFVEVVLEGGASVPRVVLQVIALCLPYAPHLRTLRLDRVELDAYSLHEISKYLLPVASALTDVCLDRSPLPEANYYLLLERGRLKRLSLTRCALGDAAVEPLARRLCYPSPASATLRILDLTSNAISDAGAGHLARALRTNRVLAHLGLAGNRVTDVGCFALLDALREFPLDYDEIYEARRRRVERARARLAEEAFTAVAPLPPAELARHHQIEGRSASSLKKQRQQERSNKSLMTEEAESAPGEPDEPYGYEDTTCRAGYAFSVGNTSLASLNLAYNDIEYPSVVRAVATLRHQRSAGLVRLVLEGNRVPGEGAGGATAELRVVLQAALLAALGNVELLASATAKRKGKSAK